MQRLGIIAPIAVAALLAGCGSSSSSSSSSATKAAASSTPAAAPSTGSSGGNQLTLSESEFKITPAAAKVTSTGTVTITVKNTGAVTHALAVQTPSGLVKTGNIAPGASATLKVDATKAGQYTFYCPIDGHRAAGMHGVLIVGSGAASSSSGGAAATPSTTTTKGASGY